MPQLSIRKLYKAREVFREIHLNAIKDDIENFVNGGTINEDNVNLNNLPSDFTSAQVGTILSKINYGDNDENSAGSDSAQTTTYQTAATVTVPSTGNYLIVAQVNQSSQVGDDNDPFGGDPVAYKIQGSTSGTLKEYSWQTQGNSGTLQSSVYVAFVIGVETGITFERDSFVHKFSAPVVMAADLTSGETINLQLKSESEGNGTIFAGNQIQIYRIGS